MQFFRMNGAGNAFLIFDARDQGALPLTPAQAREIAHPPGAEPLDQIIAMERSERGDVFMRIWNQDGGEVSACGNATRCVGWLLSEEGKAGPVTIETRAGLLKAEPAGPMRVTVDMGSPLLKWEEIPVSRATDTVAMDFAVAGPWGLKLERPGGVNMGNPHAVFFVDAVERLPVDLIGPKVERDPFFPEGVNAGFAEILAPDRMRLRVWERGAGLTKACGTGACAAVVAAHRAGLVERTVTVLADGGALEIAWSAADDRVRMTGPVVLEHKGAVGVT